MSSFPVQHQQRGSTYSNPTHTYSSVKVSGGPDALKQLEELAKKKTLELNFDDSEWEAPQIQVGSSRLADLFAEKIDSAFDLGHETVKNVLDNCLTVMAIFAITKASEEILQPLGSLVATKLPPRVTSFASRLPGTDLLKFLGLFILVKAALKPLLEKILDRKRVEGAAIAVEQGFEGTPLRKEFQRNAVYFLTPLMLAFVANKKVGGLGFNVSLVSGVVGSAIGYPLVQGIGKVAGKFFSACYQANPPFRTVVDHLLAK